MTCENRVANSASQTIINLLTILYMDYVESFVCWVNYTNSMNQLAIWQRISKQNCQCNPYLEIIYGGGVTVIFALSAPYFVGCICLRKCLLGLFFYAVFPS